MSVLRYNLEFQSIAFVLYILVTILFVTRRKLDIAREGAFRAVLMSAFLSAILDVFSILCVHTDIAIPVGVAEVIRRTYLMSIDLVAFFILMYALIEVYNGAVFSYKWNFLSFGPIAFAIPLISFLPIQKDQDVYSFGAAVFVSMGCTVIYVILFTMFVIKFRNKILPHRLNSIILSGVVILSCGFVQLAFQQLRLMSMGISVVIVYMYLGLENPDEYIDRTLNIFNRDAFVLYLNDVCSENKKVSIVTISISNMKKTADLQTSDLDSQVIKQAISYFKTITGARLFLIGTYEYCLIFEKEAHFIEKVLEIRERFKNSWEIAFGGTLVEMELSINTVAYPASRMPSVMNYDYVIGILQYYGHKLSLSNTENYICIDRKQLKEKDNYDATRVELESAVEEKRVQVIYQPVFSIQDNKCVQLEASIMVKDRNGTYMNSEIVRQVSEENGLIVPLGYEMFRQVCRFVVTHSMKNAGIDRVVFPLSVIQCQQKELGSKLIEMLERFSVSATSLQFKISEKTVINGTRNLRRNMNQLISEGASFVIGDFGEADFSPDRLTQISTTEAMIGRGTVEKYFQGEISKQYMRSMCRMLTQLNLTITASGVDTQQQYAELKNLGIHRMIGNAFYRPMDGDEILEILEKEQDINLGQEAIYERAL